MKKVLSNCLKQHKELYSNTLFYKQYNFGNIEEKNKIFVSGDLNADIVFINDDFKSSPFIGESGKLFEKILSAVGLNMGSVCIFSFSNFSINEKEDFSFNEIDDFHKYFKNKLKSINPKLIVALGLCPVVNFIGEAVNNIDGYRNKIHKYHGIDLLMTYNPSKLLVNAEFKRPVWDDFKLIRKNYLDGK